MTLSARKYWFSTTVRRNRMSFLSAVALAAVLMTGFWALVLSVFWFFGASILALSWIDVIFSVPYAVCTCFLTAQRLRDINLTGWLALLWIPLGIADQAVGGALSLAFLIVLVAVPGTAGDNRYGPDPLINDYES